MLKQIKDILFPSNEYTLDRCIELLIHYYPPKTVGRLVGELLSTYNNTTAIKRAKEIAKLAVHLPYEEFEDKETVSIDGGEEIQSNIGTVEE